MVEIACESGVYVLKHDVVNRKPDRRVRRYWSSLETWKKGTLVRLIKREGYKPRITAIDMSGDLLCEDHNKSQWEPLINALENPPKTVKAMLAVLEHEGYSHVSLADIISALLSRGLIVYNVLLNEGRELGEMESDEYNRRCGYEV